MPRKRKVVVYSESENDTEIESEIEPDSETDADPVDPIESKYFINIDEYEFDIADITTKHPVCLKCQKKYTSAYNLGVCRACWYTLSINQGNAIKYYGLKKADLADLDCIVINSGIGRCTHCYHLKQIRLIAIANKFDIDNPTIDMYANCLRELHDDYLQREALRTERSKKRRETIERNRKLRAAQAVVSDSDSDSDYGYYDKFKYDIEEDPEYTKRRDQLTSALKDVGLKLRSDSYHAGRYMNYGFGNVEAVVEMAQIMNFFATQTHYFKQIHHLAMSGSISERTKERLKIEEFKSFFNRNSDLSTVPEAVLDTYLRYCYVCDYCQEPCKRILRLTEDIVCKCGAVKHEAGTDFRVCDIDCEKLNWIFDRNEDEAKVLRKTDTCAECNACRLSTGHFDYFPLNH